ncbi:response regulator transcription factor [Vreelandella janggokensis]|uniref:response regulator transcription factor n=1 Tax=Vreelandella janggokensis TaxID=370767 RepID=UPI00285BC983|nr:response regulator transcription factor [Halomonas janggokensis]MDR5886716.1 response regulator transcription factor [Halomonas janggokensis]
MTSRQPTIAIIEDSTDLREELVFFLQHRGHNVWGTDSAESFWKKLHRRPADIVLVDLGLPGEDGFSVVDYLADLGNFGVIIVTARGQQADKLRGLNLGADLYLVKPINFSELATTLQTLWQRMAHERQGTDLTHQREQADAQWRLMAGDQCLATPDGNIIPLSPQEYTLLSILGRSPSEIFAKEALLDLMFPYDESPELHRLDVILSRLRKKAREHAISLPIRSIFGKGLVFVGQIKE